MTELTYDQAAEVLDVSPRHVRRLCRENKITPIVRGHRTVRLPANKIASLKVKITLNRAARRGR